MIAGGNFVDHTRILGHTNVTAEYDASHDAAVGSTGLDCCENRKRYTSWRALIVAQFSNCGKLRASCPAQLG